MKNNLPLVAILVIAVVLAIYFSYRAGQGNDNDTPNFVKEVQHEADQVRDDLEDEGVLQDEK